MNNIAVSNPFAKPANRDVNEGTVEIEQSRAIADAQGKLVIAKRFPRDAARAYDKVMETCSRIAFAQDATYSLPRGKDPVTGPSIRLAEAIANAWGNMDYGIRELSRKKSDVPGEGYSEMQVYCWDLETNVQSSQNWTVRHWRDTRDGGRALRDETEIYEVTASQAGRRLRSRILAVVPNDLVDAAIQACEDTIKKGGGENLTDRVRKMIKAFAKLSITASMLEARLGHSLDAMMPDEFLEFQKIHSSMKDGMSRASDWFGESAGIKKGLGPEKPNQALESPATTPDTSSALSVWLSSIPCTPQRLIEVANREGWFEGTIASVDDIPPEIVEWLLSRSKSLEKSLKS